MGPAMARIGHYFTPFQAHVIAQAELDVSRFAMDQALLILEREAKYKADSPSTAGLFVYQFEALSRNRLGYGSGLEAIAGDPAYSRRLAGLHPPAPGPARRRRLRRPDLHPLGLPRHRAAADPTRLPAQVPDPLRREGRQDRPGQPRARPPLPVLRPPAPARLPRGPPAPPPRRGRGPDRPAGTARGPARELGSRRPRPRRPDEIDLKDVLVKPEDTAGPPSGWGSEVMMIRRSMLLAFLAISPAPAAAADLKFERIVIDADFPDGYQVEVADVDGDGKPDLVGVGGGTCAWYRNPTWTEADHLDPPGHPRHHLERHPRPRRRRPGRGRHRLRLRHERAEAGQAPPGHPGGRAG